MKSSYRPIKGTALKKMLIQLKGAGLDDYATFFDCIYRYSKIAFNTYGVLKESDAHYLNSLHIIRLLSDSILTIYSLILVNNPALFVEKFLNNEPTNKLSSEGNKLTTTFVSTKASEEYKGIDIIYRESCNYLHPSIYFKAIKDEDKIGVLSVRSKWYVEGIKGKAARDCRLEFFIESLNYILYDVQLLAYNKALVPAYSELEPIKWKRDKGNIDLSFKAFKEYVAGWKERNGIGWQVPKHKPKYYDDGEDCN